MRRANVLRGIKTDAGHKKNENACTRGRKGRGGGDSQVVFANEREIGLGAGMKKGGKRCTRSKKGKRARRKKEIGKRLNGGRRGKSPWTQRFSGGRCHVGLYVTATQGKKGLISKRREGGEWTRKYKGAGRGKRILPLRRTGKKESIAEGPRQLLNVLGGAASSYRGSKRGSTQT